MAGWMGGGRIEWSVRVVSCRVNVFSSPKRDALGKPDDGNVLWTRIALSRSCKQTVCGVL